MASPPTWPYVRGVSTARNCASRLVSWRTPSPSSASGAEGVLPGTRSGEHRPRGSLCAELGLVLRQMTLDRLPDPAPVIPARHPVAAEQLLLPLEWQSGDRPAHHQALEQQL